MDITLILLVSVVALALIFDFVNGFHDSANAIATIVVSRTLTPLQAVILAGFANFIGYFFFGVTVANSIGKDVVHLSAMTLPVILAALSGAVVWNIITWVLGLPTSSSHALIGGLLGAGIVAGGFGVVVWAGVLKILAFIVLAPVFGFIGASVFTLIIYWLFKGVRPKTAGGIFRSLQLISATYYSVGHGTNDAQKTMAVIAMALVAAGVNKVLTLDSWIVLSCYTAISLGTMFGGWKIVKTMGTNITKIRQMEGFIAETAAGTVLLATAHMGIPVSTTHVISGSIMGVGSVEGVGKVKWVTARRILWAWVITIPMAALVAAVVCLTMKLFHCA